MLKKRTVFAAAFSVMLLTACQSNEGTESNGDGEQPEENGTEEVEPDQETNDSNQESSEEEVDSSNEENDSSEQNFDQVKEESYPSEEEAIDAIEDYQEIDQTNLDLGYGIKAMAEGAAGHEYISWNEGNWLMEIDFPLDPQYGVEEYEDGTSMAEAIVEYLEDNMLPAPSECGVVKVGAFKDHPETVIRWQEGKTVYEIKQETSDPLDVLQIAVDYQENKE